MRIVLDTSVLIEAFRSRQGASRRVLNLILQRRIDMVATPALFFEYETVLKRATHAEIHGYSHDEIDRFLLLFAGFTEQAKRFYHYRPQLTDPDDELVLDAAISGHACAIVTHNTSDFLPAATNLGIQVVTPGSILKQRSWS